MAATSSSSQNDNLTKGQIVVFLLIGVGALAYLSRDVWLPTHDELEPLRANVGKTACNSLNGVYSGKILGVTRDRVNQTATIVYRVQRPGSRATYAPADGVTITTGKCPDGQP